MNKKELDRCKNDILYFIEYYCLINGAHIKLKDYQKDILMKFNKHKYK